MDRADALTCGMDLLLKASELLCDGKQPVKQVKADHSARRAADPYPRPSYAKSRRIWEDEVEALDEEELKGVRKPSALAHLWAPQQLSREDTHSSVYDHQPHHSQHNNIRDTDANTPPQSPCHLPSPSSSSPLSLSRSDSFCSLSSGYTSASSSDGQGHAYEYEGSVPPGGASGSKPIKRYPCKQPGCNRSFTRLFNLKAHMETHNPDRERSFKCEHCGVAFCRAQDLLRHGTVHDKTNLMVCPACPTKTFSRKDALRRHIRVNGCCPLDSI